MPRCKGMIKFGLHKNANRKMFVFASYIQLKCGDMIRYPMHKIAIWMMFIPAFHLFEILWEIRPRLGCIKIPESMCLFSIYKKGEKI